MSKIDRDEYYSGERRGHILTLEQRERLKELAAGNIRFDVPLANYVYFRAGGSAEALLSPADGSQLATVLSYVSEQDIPVHFLGRGANVLVSDHGLSGLTICLAEKWQGINLLADNLLVAEAGANICEVAAVAARNSLSGLEFACGIPGTVGGTTRMNAGAYDGQVGDSIAYVEYLDEQGKLNRKLTEELEFSYRHSYFTDHPQYLIVRVAYELQPAERLEIYRVMSELQLRRRTVQPLELASAGSAFKRPEGMFAGKLISDAGLKGWRRGNAGVSAKHAGFIVNYGGATANEIREIFEHVRQTVAAKYAVKLEPEVRFIGDWSEV